MFAHRLAQMMRSPSVNGLLVVDKPAGLTSRDVVNRVQCWFPRGTRIGHTGTLDPLASGVLVVCVGWATRLAEYVQRMDKTYRAGLRLGARSSTDDAAGTIETVSVDRPPTQTTLTRSLEEFVGAINQVPPIYSAAHITGRRAYHLARTGKAVPLRPRLVRIHAIRLLAYDYPWLEIEVLCGKGTYIRSLARDLGERLGCGALVATLQRTRVGPFGAETAIGLETEAASARARLLPPAAAVAELPRVELGPTEITRLRQGQTIRLEDSFRLFALPTNYKCAVFDAAGTLAVVAVLDHDARSLRPVTVLSAGA